MGAFPVGASDAPAQVRPKLNGPVRGFGAAVGERGDGDEGEEEGEGEAHGGVSWCRRGT